MNFEKFRRTGELSDLTVRLDQTDFKLHTFPLFTKSEFFKKALASGTGSTPRLIELDRTFPGGVETFNQVADYLYSIPIEIDEKNLLPLRLAAAFIECEDLATLVDQQLDDVLLVARAKNDLTVPLAFLDQCTKEDPKLVKQSAVAEKCLECLMEFLAHGAGLQLSKSDREMLVRLPLEWVIQLIQLCPAESKLAILPFVKHYLSVRVLEPTVSNGDDHHSSALTADKDKRTMIDAVVKALGTELEQLPLAWLNSLYEKAVEFKCECEPTLSSYITQSVLSSVDLEESLNNIPDQVMARVLERVSKNKEEHIKDPQSLAKISTFVDSYVEQLRQRGELTSEQFVKLASCVPKEQRNSHDTLLRALDEILKDEKSTQLSTLERDELLNQIDFSRVNEETIAACKTNKLIPQQLITDAALSLCAQLRSQLDDTHTRLRSVESQLAKTRPSYSSYRSRPVETPFRLPSRSRSNYSTSYDLLRRPSLTSYSKYETDFDFDQHLPSRYLSSASSSRYTGAYSSYRY